MIVISLAGLLYLIATKQVFASIDGIFLTIVCLLGAACFALYVSFVINGAKAEIAGKK